MSEEVSEWPYVLFFVRTTLPFPVSAASVLRRRGSKLLSLYPHCLLSISFCHMLGAKKNLAGR